MQLALSDRQSAAAAKARLPQAVRSEADLTGTNALGQSGVSPSIEDVLNRANARINQAIAEGLLTDPTPAADAGGSVAGESVAGGSVERPTTATDTAAAPAIRPLLQALIQRDGDLGTVLDAFAAADPGRFKPERLIALLEDALNDVEKALTPAAEPDHPSVIDLVAKPDIDPAALFTPLAQPIRRAGELRLRTEPVAANVLPAPEARERSHSWRPIFVTLIVIGLMPVVAAPLGRDPVMPSSPPVETAQAPVPVAAPAPEQVAASVPTSPVEPASPKLDSPKPGSSEPGGGVEAALVSLYAARGDEMLAKKDISAARKFYEFAAGAGDARAALALARTYDPAFFAQYGVIGLHADPALASIWYRRAALLDGPASVARR